MRHTSMTLFAPHFVRSFVAVVCGGDVVPYRVYLVPGGERVLASQHAVHWLLRGDVHRHDQRLSLGRVGVARRIGEALVAPMHRPPLMGPILVLMGPSSIDY